MAGAAPEGFWISPGFEWHQIRGTFQGIVAESPGWAVGGQLGYTAIIGDVFQISIGAGADYNKRELTFEWEEAGVEKTKLRGYSGVLPTARFSLGGAF
ncbi:hypothetical protein [Vulgatibacter sp.]|uniref:hypothetical protein n=1 Tax=Vulgatibacter sp. TaxID=1971226 RepID=UPI0035691F19